MRTFHLTTERKADGIHCSWPNGELAGIIKRKTVKGTAMVLWQVQPKESGMPGWSFHNLQAAEYYMLAACYEYVDNTGEEAKLEKKAA